MARRRNWESADNDYIDFESVDSTPKSKRKRKSGWQSIERKDSIFDYDYEDAPKRRNRFSISDIPPKALAILGLVVLIVLIAVIIVSNQSFFQKIGEGIENFVFSIFSLFIYALVIWGIFIYTIGKKFSKKGKSTAFIIILALLVLTQFIPTLATTILTVVIMLLILKYIIGL